MASKFFSAASAKKDTDLWTSLVHFADQHEN
jgi:hypothetical protein